MVAVLEIPEVRRRVLPVSVKAYHAYAESGLMPGQAELIRGVVVEKLPKSPRHTYYTQWLFHLLDKLLPGSMHVRKEDPITCIDSEPEPDIAVVQGTMKDYLTQHPTTALLVIEVCLSTEALDREKMSIYAEAAVQEYWLVLPDEQRVEIYREPVQGSYAVCEHFTREALVVCTSVPGFEVKLADFFEA